MNSIQKLAKFIQYVLGRSPDEFGLVPDPQGFVKIKSLVQALHEDPEWRFVRRAHFNELLLTCSPAPIEIHGIQVRASDRSLLPRPQAMAGDWPKLLYVAIRQRNHPAVTTNGIYPNQGIPHIVLSPTKEFALQLGKRIDNQPVLITVKVAESHSAGAKFQRFGEHLYLSSHLPPDGLISPPLSKAFSSPQKAGKSDQPSAPKTPGSFFIDPLGFGDSPVGDEKPKHRRSADWKKDRRMARKYKNHNQTEGSF